MSHSQIFRELNEKIIENLLARIVIVGKSFLIIQTTNILNSKAISGFVISRNLEVIKIKEQGRKGVERILIAKLK